MKIKRKPVMASSGYNDDTVFVIFRKVRVDGQWVPVAFWYSSGQTLNYGRLYAIMPEFGGYTCEEADMGFYNASKKLTPADPGYDDLKEYTYDWLSDHGDGQGGFKKIVERQRVDYNGLRTSWYRDTIPDDDSVEYSVHSSTDIKAATQYNVIDDGDGDEHILVESFTDMDEAIANAQQYSNENNCYTYVESEQDGSGDTEIVWTSDTDPEIVKYTDLAEALGDALRDLVHDESALENFISYLSYHFPDWLSRYAYTPESFVSEIEHFSKLG